MNSLVRRTPPLEPVLSLEEARAHLKVDASGSPPAHDDDDEIQRFVEEATDDIDGATGWLGRALVTQGWRLVLDTFPPYCGVWHSCMVGTGRIALPLTSPKIASSPPPDSVSSITYIDRDGVEVMLDPSEYRVVTEFDPQFVEPVFGGSWPPTRATAGAVRIDYTAGYGAADDVPNAIRGYIKVLLGMRYAVRELAAPGAPISVSPYLRDSLENFRLRGALP